MIEDKVMATPGRMTIEGVDFDAEVKCGGHTIVPSRVITCPHPAMFMSRSHGCEDRFKCFDCYVAWRDGAACRLRSRGYLICERCGVRFDTIEAFSDYRPI